MKHTVSLIASLGAIGLGAFLALRRRGGGSLRGAHEARELQLFCENDADLYRQQVQPIEKNLSKRLAKGTYDHEKAKKLWGYLADNCAKKYGKEFGDDQPWHKLFSTADRREVAKNFADSFKAEHGRR